MEHIHLLNEDIVDLIPKVKLLHSMYEDADTGGRKREERFLHKLDRLFPEKFVKVTSGGETFKPSCHMECWTYEHNYGLYIVEASLWSRCAELVLHVDRSFRIRQMRCQRQVG